MRVDAMIVPAIADASTNANCARGVKFAININDAERAAIDKARHQPLIGASLVSGGVFSEYDAFVEFMTAAAEVFAPVL